MRTFASLTIVQLAFVLDAVVLRVVRVHQITYGTLLHSTIRNVEVQPPQSELLRPSIAPCPRLGMEWRINDDHIIATCVFINSHIRLRSI